ncbi:hypothetical protein QLS71_002670 [Mariniflexile litorale]|uniref:O-antigen/teichoic acid export membrane protein n=1 Tax=Mariniflexile litorale TaxID=3045158 RepID=A0AAU7EHJ1_9FLAO|nr:hypothetical protein [Mariniflexile sp. KMM 9835]MDQ8209922.1 hypothetical protein [Mariniflexile sp. KMM 9835]
MIVISALIGSGHGVIALKESAVKKGFDYKILIKLLISVFINLGFISLLLLITNMYFSFLNTHLMYGLVSYSLSAFLIEVIRSKTSGNMYIFLKDVTRSVSLLLLVFFIPSRSNVYLINLSSAIVLCCIIIYLIILLFKYGIEKNDINFSIKDLYFKGWSIALGISSQFLKIRLDIFLAGIFFNKTIVGMYDVLMKLGQLINLPGVALNADIAKQFASSIRLNQYSENLRKRIKTTKFLGYVFSVVCILLIPFYLKFYDYDINFQNVSLAIIILLANTVSCYFGPIGLFAQLSTLKNYFLKIITLFILISALLSYLLVPYMGLFSLAISNFITAIIWNYFIHKKIQKTYHFSI